MHLLRASRTALVFACVWTLVPALARAAAGHGPDVRPVLLALVVVLVGAKLGGALFEFFRPHPWLK